MNSFHRLVQEPRRKDIFLCFSFSSSDYNKSVKIMEKEQLQKNETEEMVSSYKQQIRDKKKEFKALKNSLNQERKAFLKEIKAEIRQVRKEERAKSLSPEEKEALKKKKAELISKKRKELLLPVYTQGEELMNAISHIVGGAFALIATIVGIYFAAVSGKDTIPAVICMAVYGFSMLFLYTMSSIYHFLGVNKAKKVFQVLDHCTIYILIAGTYVPVCVLMLPSTMPLGSYVILGVVVLLSVLGVVLNATMMQKKAVKIISNLLYLVIGWLIIFFFPWLLDAIGLAPCLLFLFGGISYSIGAILYGIGRFKRYFHFIFHLFCLAGTILQFIGILLFFL